MKKMRTKITLTFMVFLVISLILNSLEKVILEENFGIKTLLFSIFQASLYLIFLLIFTRKNSIKVAIITAAILFSFLFIFCFLVNINVLPSTNPPRNIDSTVVIFWILHLMYGCIIGITGNRNLKEIQNVNN